jgi:hypothetical protein
MILARSLPISIDFFRLLVYHYDRDEVVPAGYGAQQVTREEWAWSPEKGYLWYLSRPLLFTVDWIIGRRTW